MSADPKRVAEFVRALNDLDICDEIDTEDAINWPSDPNFHPLLLSMLQSPYQPLFDVASYVFSESVHVARDLMDKAVQTLRQRNATQKLWFVSRLMHYRDSWNESYSLELVSCLSGGSLLTREYAIRALVGFSVEDFERFAHFLQIGKSGSVLKNDLDAAYMRERNAKLWFERDESFDEVSGDPWVYINRLSAVRGVLIAHEIRCGRFNALDGRIDGEDESTLRSLISIYKQK